VNATANTMVYNAGSTAWVNLAGLRWIAES
jgi:hypothetical protein